MGPQYRTTGEAAEQWGVSRATALRWCQDGWVKGAKRMGCRWRIPVSTVDHIARHGIDMSEGAEE